MDAHPASRATTIIAWIAQVLAAAILITAASSKLTSAPDAIALFSTLGVEPWGRFALGSVELLTAALLLFPRTAGIGGLFGIVLMTGAIATHLFKIGVMYGGDPSLFIMAVLVFLSSAITVYLRRPRMPF